ncbi:MAG: cache domain-containing protein [Candidatus Altiarchaeota archaeon]|nr:cache domain-containing protein [Candidatus Altiarchaeota archaeon]
MEDRGNVKENIGGKKMVEDWEEIERGTGAKAAARVKTESMSTPTIGRTKKTGVRTKLMLAFIATAVIPVLVMSVSLWMMAGDINNFMTDNAQEKVNTFYGITDQVYQSEMHNVKETAIAAASLDSVADLVQGTGNKDSVRKILLGLQSAEEVGYLTVLDASGRVVLRSNPNSASGDTKSDAWIRTALAGTATVSSEVLNANTLAEYGLDVQSKLFLITTDNAKPTSRTVETSSLSIVAAAPIKDSTGRVIGAVEVGEPLTRNYKIVDNAKDIYGTSGSPTVTIFQDDLRISTNVKTKGGSRAIGTRVSVPVYEQVLTRGQEYVGRAFVVNDWYMTLYKPIKSGGGSTVGILYVGLLERDIKTDIGNFISQQVSNRILFGGVIAFILAMLCMWLYLRGLE